MAKCYGCKKEVERNTDKTFGNVYIIKKGFLSGSEEVIICSGDSGKDNGCWYAMDEIFDKGVFKEDKWYEFGFNMNSKILTSKGVQTINDNKTFFKRYSKVIAKNDEFAKARIDGIEQKIVSLLQEKSKKMSISDIAAFLKEDREEVKWLLESLYEEKKIDFAGNGRYFILKKEKKKPKGKKAAAPKSEAVDVEKELEKLKGLLDKGLITQEAYDAKMNQLLGL